MLKIENGACALSGDLIFQTTPNLKESGDFLLKESPDSEIVFDLKNVGKVDSSALALFLSWLRIAQGKSQTLRFANAPLALRELAALYSLQNILPL